MKGFLSLALVGLALQVGCIDSVQGEKRIIGGEAVPLEDRRFEWVASLETYTIHLCGGALIHSRWILTAAHCLGAVTSVSVARYDRQQTTESNYFHVPVLREIKHPLFNPYDMSNDIALIEIDTSSVELVTQVKPVKLFVQQDAEWRTEKNPSDLSFILGWGATNTDDYAYSGQLMRAFVPLVPQQQCKAKYKDRLKPGMFCAGLKEGGKDSCMGDSGGPLAIEQSDGEIFQIGIVSWGDGCAKSNSYGVYTQVSSYINWIESTTQGEWNLASNGVPAKKTTERPCFQKAGSGTCISAKRVTKRLRRKTLCSSRKSCSQLECEGKCQSRSDCTAFEFGSGTCKVILREAVRGREEAPPGSTIDCFIRGTCCLGLMADDVCQATFPSAQHVETKRVVCSFEAPCSMQICEAHCVQHERCSAFNFVRDNTRETGHCELQLNLPQTESAISSSCYKWSSCSP